MILGSIRSICLSLLFAVPILAANTAAAASTCGKVAENQPLPLSCDNGQVIKSISFASYGTPKGACGSFTVSKCNAASSLSKVQASCLGKASCKLTATNGVFGDPCTGVTKSLAVQVKCGAATTQPQPPSDPNWVKCANESSVCNFSGVRNVRYGANNAFVTKLAVTGPINCTNAAFANDPAVGLTKYCEYSSAVVTQPAPQPQPEPTPVPNDPIGSNIVPPAPVSIPSNTLAVPTGFSNGATVSLLCGRVYRGTLDLHGKSNVTVNVSGTCGKPTIIPNAGQDGIDAVNGRTIRIDGIKVQGANRGININNAEDVKISNTDILNSRDSGIYSSGIVGMEVINSSISDSGNTGIDGGSWVVKGKVLNTTITRSGANGGNYNGIGIYFGDGNNNTVDHVTVTQSVYHGIVVLHNSYTTVSKSVVTASCTGPDHDCGAIYTGARDRKPLSLNILDNSVSDCGGIGIYLDDSSNSVLVKGNSVTKSMTGITLHNAFNISITGNNVFSNRSQHVQFAQDIANAVYGNSVIGNIFKVTNNERTFNLEVGDVRNFSTFDYNTYIGNAPAFGRSWDGGPVGVDYTYSAWKNFMKSDAHSTMNDQP